MVELSVGGAAPDFTLARDGGGTVRLSALRGRKVVLFFYPKADTPGCTLESKDFSCLADAFAAADTELIGISADPVKKQDRFKTKYDLALTLASDETHAMLETYGVWTQKSMFGRKYMGIERTTVLINRDGRIARVWPKVTVEGHAQEVLDAAKAL
ncbi:peroxiredoxin [Labrys wisconsinensis]|uniref:thioredoxin-dependent peroxiredoxin n=1 Tax=Labrys wisconsinensis TaxID=425677 RepID=A0ABU0J425_9HYPH|nr:peroxiredoxin [Labrys wisconsinensis]MDQ0469027.1 peroxiredoxin Q/BCP [Labrys wisconsinensis]